MSVLIAVSVLALAGCADSSQSLDLSTVSGGGTASEALVEFDKDGLGSLNGVTIVPSAAYASEVGSKEDLAAQTNVDRVEVGIPDTLHGIDTQLIVPMWYDEQTVYQIADAKGLPLSEVVADGSVVWRGDPVARVDFHRGDGVIVLDRIWVPRSR